MKDLQQRGLSPDPFSTLDYIERWGGVFAVAGNDFTADLTAMHPEDREGAERIHSAPGRRQSILTALRTRKRAMRERAAVGVLQ